ncbi:cytochrome p450 family protein [Paraphaeosphaeria sporulosa]
MIMHEQVFTVLALSIITVVTCTVAHKLILHPLAKYPGPLFSRISGWPNWYHAAKGDRHIWLLRLHSKYGSAVRFSPDSMSFNTLAAVENIYTSREANVRKGDWYQCVKDSAGGFESTFTARDKVRHALKRRILAHAFSERALRDYECRIKRLTKDWLDYLVTEGKGSRTVDFAAWANYIIFDILGDLCYGKDFGLRYSERDRYVTELLPRTTRIWYMLGYHPWTHLLRYLLFKNSLTNKLGRLFVRENSNFREFCVAALMWRMKVGKASDKDAPVSQDMFQYLLKARDQETGEGFSMGDLGAESVLLMIAGTHTTSIAIAAIIFYLTTHEDKLEKVAGEIQKEFLSIEDMSYRRLAALPYLRACINEALRLCPPTAGHLQREALSGGTVIDGVRYPEGTNLGVSAYALQRNPHIWLNPNQFEPERWLQDDGTFNQRSQPRLIAFSSGPLGCPGKQLAYMEMSFVVAMLIYHLDITLNRSEGCNVDYVIRDCYVGQSRGPRLHIRTRE